MGTRAVRGRAAELARSDEAAVVVVLTDHDEVLDHVLSITSAVGVEPRLLSDAGALRPLWSTAALVLVGVDQAGQAAALLLPRRGDVYVLGGEQDRDDVHVWSVPLGAAVVTLPDQASWLAGAIADRVGAGQRAGALLCVVGGSGGVGASTLAAGLAFTGARVAGPTLLVDADPGGGGLDLLVGAERVDGWRWPRLARASGHLGDLRGQLPQVEGVDVLSMARGGSGSSGELAPDQLRSVVESATRSHACTVVDLPRSLGPAAGEALTPADAVLLVVAGSVRGVAAAQETARRLEAWCQPQLVVRATRARSLSPSAVAEGLGLALLGTLEDDPALVAAADRGDPPGRAARSPIGRLARLVLGTLAADGAVVRPRVDAVGL